MDQGVPRKLSTRTTPVSRVLFEMQDNIFELLDRASAILCTAAHSTEQDLLTIQSLLAIEEVLVSIQSLLQYWEEELQITLGKVW